MKNNRECVLNPSQECKNCGDCNKCDLNPDKECNNCCKCISDGIDYRAIKIQDILLNIEDIKKKK